MRAVGQTVTQHRNEGATMKTLRKILATGALAVALSTEAQAQGIPVIDASTLAQAIMTVQQLKQEYSTISDQYNSLTGNRGLGQIFDNPSLRNYLPDDWQSVYDSVNRGQLNGISGMAKSIEQAEGGDAFTPGQVRLNQTLAANKAMTMRAYDGVLDRLNNIKALMQQTDMTQDPAAKADLQNRWSAEVANINNEKIRLDLMARLQDAEKEYAERQQEQEFKNQLLGRSSDQ